MNNRMKRRIEFTCRILFFIYLGILMYLLFFSEYYGRTIVTDYRYNLTLFREIHRFWTYREKLGMAAMLTNLGGNIVCFMPFGFFLPNMYDVFRKHGVLVILSGFLLTCGIELLQLYTRVGVFDVDDIFLNTSGAILGYVVHIACGAIRRKIHEKKTI